MFSKPIQPSQPAPDPITPEGSPRKQRRTLSPVKGNHGAVTTESFANEAEPVFDSHNYHNMADLEEATVRDGLFVLPLILTITLQGSSKILHQYKEIRDSLIHRVVESRGPPETWCCSLCSMDLCPVTPAQEMDQLCRASEQSCAVNYALRCLDCTRYPVYCRECIKSEHRMNPYHRIEIARPGNFCEATSLSKQGYILHLHQGNNSCSGDATKIKEIQNFVVVDSQSIHTFVVETCSCTGSSVVDQLILAGLFPATFSSPRTAFTFDALDYYLIDNTICHTTAYSFNEKLKHRTNPLLALSKHMPVSEIWFSLMLAHCLRTVTGSCCEHQGCGWT